MFLNQTCHYLHHLKYLAIPLIPYMRKIFATNLIFLLLLNVVIKPLWIFAIDRNVQITLGAQEYGFYFTLFNFSLLFNFLLDMGITNFNNREISYHPQRISHQFINIVAIKLILSLIYLSLTIGLALVLGFQGRQIVLLTILTINQFLASFLLFVRSNLNGLHYFRADSILSVMDKAILILLVSMFLWGNLTYGFTVEVFALCQTLSYSIAILIALWLLKGSYRVTINNTLEWLAITKLVKKGLPFAVLVLLMTLYSRLDTVLVERLNPGGAVLAGIYAQAFRLFDAFNMYSYLFAALMLPIFSRMISRNEDISEFFNFSFKLLLIPVITIAIPTMVFNYPVMEILYHEHIDISAKALIFLMGSFVFVAFAYLFGTALTAMGNIWLLCKISLVVVIIGLAAMLIMIPRLGVSGAALANLCSNALAAVLQGIFFVREKGLTIQKSTALKVLNYTAIYSAINILLQLVLGKSLVGFAVSLASSIIIIFSLRLLTFRTIHQYLKGMRE